MQIFEQKNVQNISLPKKNSKREFVKKNIYFPRKDFKKMFYWLQKLKKNRKHKKKQNKKKGKQKKEKKTTQKAKTIKGQMKIDKECFFFQKRK